MTHDDLLAKIDNDSYDWDGANNAAALRAVVELHKPTKEEIWGNYNCEECRKGNADRWVQYPCSTIEAIKKELK